MYNEANADIRGILNKDIELRKTNEDKRYGLLEIIIGQHSYNKNKHRFNVLIWNQILLNKHSNNLKKGTKIWIVGELEAVSNKSEESANLLTINVTSGRGVSIGDQVIDIDHAQLPLAGMNFVSEDTTIHKHNS